MSILPKHSMVAVVYLGGGLGLYDISTGLEVQQASFRNCDATCLVFDTQSSTLITAGADKVLRVWKPSTGRQVRQFRLPLHDSETIVSMSVCRRGKLIATGSVTHGLLHDAVRIIDMETGQQVTQIGKEHGWVYSVVYSPTAASPQPKREWKTASSYRMMV